MITTAMVTGTACKVEQEDYRVGKQEIKDT
jgi:hypothetical protein